MIIGSNCAESQRERTLIGLRGGPSEETLDRGHILKASRRSATFTNDALTDLREVALYS